MTSNKNRFRMGLSVLTCQLRGHLRQEHTARSTLFNTLTLEASMDTVCMTLPLQEVEVVPVTAKRMV